MFTEQVLAPDRPVVLRWIVPVLVGSRLGIGAWAAVRPSHLADAVGVTPDQQEDAVPYARVLAARELVLATGASVALVRRRGCGGWVAAMAASDVFDALVYELLAELGTLERKKARRATYITLSAAVAEALVALGLSGSRH